MGAAGRRLGAAAIDNPLALLIRASRWVIPGRGHGCTDLALVAARTYGWHAAGYALRLAQRCYHEHPHR